jgi:hypothetical protein
MDDSTMDAVTAENVGGISAPQTGETLEINDDTFSASSDDMTGWPELSRKLRATVAARMAAVDPVHAVSAATVAAWPSPRELSKALHAVNAMPMQKKAKSSVKIFMANYPWMGRKNFAV